MFCKNCGTALPEGAFECPVCHAMADEQPKNASSAFYSTPNYGAPNQDAPHSGTTNENAYGNPYYTPPQQPYGMQYQQMVEKSSNARILAILGLILGMGFPIAGWILGGIALSKAKQVFAYTGSPESKTTITIAHWAIGVSSVIAGLALLSGLFMIIGVSAVSVAGSFL